MHDLIPSVDVLASMNSVLISVQDYWTVMENIIINAVDKYAPLVNSGSKAKSKSIFERHEIKSKLNKRKRLLRQDKQRNTQLNAPAIRVLNLEIRTHFSKCKINIPFFNQHRA